MKDWAPKNSGFYSHPLHNSYVAIVLGGVCRKKTKGPLMLALFPSIVLQYEKHGSVHTCPCVYIL